MHVRGQRNAVLFRGDDMRVQFSAQVTVPDGTPEDDVLAWLRFNLGCTCMITRNAMGGADLECDYVMIEEVMS